MHSLLYFYQYHFVRELSDVANLIHQRRHTQQFQVFQLRQLLNTSMPAIQGHQRQHKAPWRPSIDADRSWPHQELLDVGYIDEPAQQLVAVLVRRAGRANQLASWANPAIFRQLPSHVP